MTFRGHPLPAGDPLTHAAPLPHKHTPNHPPQTHQHTLHTVAAGEATRAPPARAHQLRAQSPENPPQRGGRARR
jgi:hypothetical protein